MLNVTKHITLDFGRNSSEITVLAKQGDKNSRYIRVTPVFEGKTWSIPEGTHAFFAMRKPDGKHVYNEQSIEGGDIIIELTDQTLVVAGKSLCTVVLESNAGDILTTQNFILDVEYSPGAYAELESTDEVQSLQKLIEYIEDLLEHGGLGGGAPLSDINPLMNGEASPGVSKEASRADHVHPTDESRMPAIDEMESGDISDESKVPFMDDADGMMRYLTWARILALTNAASYYHTVSDNDPLMNGEASPGTADKFSRDDHVHPTDTSRMPTDISGLGNLISRVRTLEGDDKFIVEDSKENKPKYCTWTEIISAVTTLFGPAISDALIDYYDITETEAYVQEYAQAKGEYLIPQDLADHNTDKNAHNDIRLLIDGLASRLNALADSDDTTLDQLSEIVAYIQANRGLIESVTTSKINVTDIINNLITNVADKPLSAAQGVELKRLIDAIIIPTKVSAFENDRGYLTSYTESDPTVSDWAKASTKPSYTKSEVGLGNVDNVKQYSASNPPPYPVTSVNGKTGAVSLTADDVNAQSKGNYVTADKTITITGVDENGATHTWTVYGVKS